MGNYLRIPGESPLPVLRSPSPRPRGPGLFFLIFLFLFCAAGYAFFKYGPSLGFKGEKQETVPPAPAAKLQPVTVPTAEAEDLLHHLAAADAQALEAAKDLHRSEEWLARVSPELDREYLARERRQLDAATASLESARRSVEQSREELELSKNLLQERSQ